MAADTSLIEAVRRFCNEEVSEAWFVEKRWGGQIRCGHCNSENILVRKNRKPMPFYCRACKSYFSVRTGTLMQHSKIPLSKWAIAFHIFISRPKGVSSVQLAKDLGISQKHAWHMGHRIRECWNQGVEEFAGPVEVDEAYIGGKERNKHKWKRRADHIGGKGKMAVEGVLDRETGCVQAAPIPDTKHSTLQGFVHDRTTPEAVVYSDGARAYDGLDRAHESVNHGDEEYVRGKASVNGMESHWALFKRSFHGTHHTMSEKHLHRYVNEFNGRSANRRRKIDRQMVTIVKASVGRRLSYRALTA